MTLAPVAPYAWAATKEAGKEFAKTIGGESAKKLIEWLKPKAEARPVLQSALTDLANTPQDADAQAAVRHQLKKLLEEQPSLVSELKALLQISQQTHIEQHVSGDGSIVSGRDTHLDTLTNNFRKD